MRPDAACAIGAFVLGLTACDVFHGPVVYNRSGSAVVVSWSEPAGRKELMLPDCSGGPLHSDPDGTGRFRDLSIIMPDGRVFEAPPDMAGALARLEAIAVVSRNGVDYVDGLVDQGGRCKP